MYSSTSVTCLFRGREEGCNARNAARKVHDSHVKAKQILTSFVAAARIFLVRHTFARRYATSGPLLTSRMIFSNGKDIAVRVTGHNSLA